MNKRHSMYALVGITAVGKDTLVDLAIRLAEERVRPVIRYTTRAPRSLDYFTQSISLEQMNQWDEAGELVSRACIYGNWYVVRRDDHEKALCEAPLLSHMPVHLAEQYRGLGFRVRLSRLLPHGRRVYHMPHRVLDRSDEDILREREILSSMAFDGPDIMNDFSQDSSSGFVDSSGKDIPLGAARAALRWLDFIATEEKWEKDFLRPYFQQLSAL